MKIFKDNWKYIVVFIFGVTIGAVTTYYFFSRVVTKEIPVEKTVVETKVEYKDRTKIQYIPKELIINPTTGQSELEKTDVQLNKEQTRVNVKVNSEEYAFNLLQGEQQKFQDGKIMLEQSSSLNVDVTAQVEQQITGGIKKAFENQKKKPQWKIGIEAEVDSGADSNANLRLSRQANSFDLDFRVNKDKKLKFGATKWF